MLKNIKKEKAITLIALVVTIVVILILAGISIVTLTGENGIINKANVAKEESKKAEYKEELELIGLGLQVEDGINNLSTKDFMEKYKEKIVADAMFKGAKLNGPIDENDTIVIIVITKEGYVYKITKTKVDFIGKQGETAPPDLEESDIEGICNPDGWTNGEVKVTVKVNNKELSKCTIQYSLDGKTNWKTYTGPITFKDNGSLFVRLQNELLEFGGATTVNVANIDRLAPKQFVPTATSTTKSITLTGSTTDAPKTEKDGCSGIKEYYFSNDNGATWKQNSNKLATSYTFNSLTQNKEYTLKMKAVDKAGNEVVTSAITKTTGKVEGAKGATYSPTTWTNTDVTVTLPTKTGYTTRYVTNGGTPTKDSIEYKGPFKVSGNCVINYCYSDGTNIGGNGTANITIIDKLVPKNATIKLSGTSTNTSGNVTATVTHTDEQADSKNAQSGINIAKCKWVYNTTSTAIGVNESSYTGGTFTSNGQKITLKTATVGTYYLHVLTTDNAGNKKETISETIKVTGNLSSQVNVGDYVAYKAGTHSYTSKKGTGTTGGNGYDTPQTFTSNDNIKWRVLSKENNEVVLISEEPIKTDDNKNFYLNGAIGYLYAEEELNKICSIYGHGVGANTSKTFSYEVGDVVEGVEKRTLTGSGARSITVEDVNKICGVTPSAELNDTSRDYGKEYTKSMYYPTRTKETGKSGSAASRTYKNTLYLYTGSDKILATSNEYKMLFRNRADTGNITYWLASRCVSSDSISSSFLVRFVGYGNVAYIGVGSGTSYIFNDHYNFGGVCPIVYLKSDIQTSGKDSSGAWKIE